MGIEIGDNVEFFKLVKIDPAKRVDFADEFTEVAIRLKNSDFSMKSIEGIIHQKEKLQSQISNLTTY